MKKTFYQRSVGYISAVVIQVLFVILTIYVTVVCFLGYADIHYIIVMAIGLAIMIYSFVGMAHNKVVFYEEKIFVAGHKTNVSNRIQFQEEIRFYDIENVNRVFANRNSRRGSMKGPGMIAIRPLPYFEFVLKNGRKKWLCITFFSRKQRREMISIISEKTGLNLNYDKMVEEDLSYFARKKKSKEKDKKVA